mmetsp:Transcript_1761/g.3730  ORF Transcript_1761/g.3730 Transcript_1761/m.3730 type:complete len:152 (+) Transcript_1761:558-1013(+)
MLYSTSNNCKSTRLIFCRIGQQATSKRTQSIMSSDLICGQPQHNKSRMYFHVVGTAFTMTTAAMVDSAATFFGIRSSSKRIKLQTCPIASAAMPANATKEIGHRRTCPYREPQKHWNIILYCMFQIECTFTPTHSEFFVGSTQSYFFQVIH